MDRGMGCHSAQGWERASYLPPHERQTVNRAELQAAIEVLKYYGMQSIRLAVATDSAYVFSGVQGTALRWRANGWVTAQGPVPNVDQWIDLMNLIDSAVATLEWIKVPSHSGIAGNDRADQLAEEGRKASPLYITAGGRVPRPMTPLQTPPQRPQVDPDDVVFTGWKSRRCAMTTYAPPSHCGLEEGRWSNHLLVGMLSGVCLLRHQERVTHKTQCLRTDWSPHQIHPLSQRTA